MRRRDFLTAALALMLADKARGFNLTSAVPAQQLLMAQCKFGIDLALRLRKSNRSDDLIAVSPASVAALLSTLALAADDRLQTAIEETLGFGGVSQSRDLEAVRALVKDAATDGETRLSIANALVIDPMSQPYAATIERLRANGTEVALQDPGSAEVVKQLNAWVTNKTHGAITQILDAPPRAAGLIATNVLYFKGFWLDRFDVRLTEPQTFYSPSGESETSMMRRTGVIPLRQDGRFVAVDLPYKSGRFSFVALTTADAPARIDEFPSDADWLMGQGFSPNELDLSLPRFTLQNGAELLEALDALGLKAGRTATAFAPLSAAPQLLSRIVQRTFLAVDEEGTEAAAATAAVTIRSAPRRKNITFDKPFVFALRDSKTGLVLLSGYVGRLPGTVAVR